MIKSLKNNEFAVRVFAILLILAGIDSLAAMVLDLFRGNLNVDLGVLGLLVGKGLLLRKERWRKWAVFLAWAGIVCAPLFGIIIALPGGTVEPIELFGVDTGTFLPAYVGYLMLGVWFAFSLWQRAVLTSREARSLFTEEGEVHSSWWPVIVAVGVVITVLDHSERHLARSLLESIDHHEVTIQTVDAESGELLNPRVTQLGGFSGKVFPKTTYSSWQSNEGGMVVGVEWLAPGPITIHLAADGYAEKEVVLGPKVDRQVLRVELQAVETGNDGLKRVE